MVLVSSEPVYQSTNVVEVGEHEIYEIYDVFKGDSERGVGRYVHSTLPKRLFNVVTMKTVFCDDVADDVNEKGYVAVSHVWGDQKKYTADELGIKHGVDWEIPLSDPDKIRLVRDVVIDYEKEYCWFDVLCMPQGEDRQWEVNLEIPLMGSYYANAVFTMALSTMDPIFSEDYKQCYDMIEDAMEMGAKFSQLQEDWIRNTSQLLDLSGEKWFTRLWTFQEGAMSKELLLIRGNEDPIRLFDIAEKISYMSAINKSYAEHLFGVSGNLLADMLTCKEEHRWQRSTLVDMMAVCSMRDCFKPQDKFYGVLGILVYKDFSVDYNIDMDDLNMAIVKYAYSKGDISWIFVGGDEGKGFVQPLYKPFSRIGFKWEDNMSDMYGIRIEDDILHINAWSFAEVICCERVGYHEKVTDFLGWICRVTSGWKLRYRDIVDIFTSFRETSDEMAEMMMVFLGGHAVGRSDETITKYMDFRVGREFVDAYYGKMLNMFSETSSMCREATVVKAVDEVGHFFPLIVSGNAEIGDQIMLTRMHDKHDRTLGIVVGESRRKGVFLHRKVEMSEDDISICYTPYQFPL